MPPYQRIPHISVTLSAVELAMLKMGLATLEAEVKRSAAVLDAAGMSALSVGSENVLIALANLEVKLAKHREAALAQADASRTVVES